VVVVSTLVVSFSAQSQDRLLILVVLQRKLAVVFH
jgi:hypothetical protein